MLQTLKDFGSAKNAVWGVTTRNREQNFAMNLLMDPEIDFVTLTGTAGTGKTLLALAAGLTQVLDDRRYTEIIMTRATVSVGEDIGFLPGTEEEKMGPWMGALDDNLEFLAKGRRRQCRRMGPRCHQRTDPQPHQDQEHELHARAHVPEQVRDHRRGTEPDAQADEDAHHPRRPGTKIICMGNLAQIDTPYLTEGLRPDLCGGPLQRLAAQRAHYAGTRRTFAPGRLRQRGALTMVGWVTALKLVPWGDVIEATPDSASRQKLLGATRKGQSRGDGIRLYRRRRDGSRPATDARPAEAFA